MRLDKLFGLGRDDDEDEGEGKVVIRVEVEGKTYTRRYHDMEMAQLRFPQALADLAVLHSRTSEEE